MKDSFPDLIAEMQRLVSAADAKQLHLRAFGGLAIYAHSRKDPRFFHRDSPDVDFIVPRSERRKIEQFFEHRGYAPDKQFNLLNGEHRQIYHEEITGRRIDILVGDFEMCHKLPLADRWYVDPVTIPLAELFLSKAQIVQLNRKDAFDMMSLLLNNELGNEKDGKIGLDRIAFLCGEDWGLFKTTTINLKRLEDLLLTEELGLSDDERERLVSRVRQLMSVLESAPKSVAWKARSLVGTRVRWYAEVEEVDQE